jgi:DNA-binding beta-propeller fold protein YncE
MSCRSLPTVALTLAFCIVLSSGASAQLAVSANDGKAVLIDGVETVPDRPMADNVAIIDLEALPPRLVGTVEAPTSVEGPPQSIAIAPDQSFAIVTGGMRIDSADRKRAVPDNKLTVIDLKARPPVVLSTLKAGLGAAGVSINRAGTLALVANRAEGTVSVFTVTRRTLNAAGKVDLGNDKSRPGHVVFTPDGRMALVTREGDHKISVLAIDGTTVKYTKRDMYAGIGPSSITMSPNGNYAVVANAGMGGGDTDTLSVIDVTAAPARVVNTVSIGQTPEAVSFSPDGEHIAVTVMNGSNKPKASPFFSNNGLVKVMKLRGTRLKEVDDAEIGHWCQGAAWNRDGSMLLVQCMVEKQIALFGFNGNRLTTLDTVRVDGGPAAIRSSNQ